MGTIRRKGKSGNAKHGRDKRKPAHKRYNAEDRRERNKEIRMARIARKMERKKEK